ncbi:hypothetical protein GJAV_G00226810 [Gymnothorax javanicus]|nr:hypothetical protein GJAV_G00226810 [Gymnothorax javanicus]
MEGPVRPGPHAAPLIKRILRDVADDLSPTCSLRCVTGGSVLCSLASLKRDGTADVTWLHTAVDGEPSCTPWD